ncbi:MAG: metallophosphoesterase family protein [bacterium]|nr:metallophosphoesterase family protein [bacterium]
MNYLLISDVHSNYQALEAIFQKADSVSTDYNTICVGDIVGYGAQPNECMETILRKTGKVVLGNHDAGVIGKTDIRMFNYSAREAIIWTRENLKKENLKKLYDLPYLITEGDFAVVHSSPSNPEYWNYIDSVYEAQDEFKVTDYRITFIGHTHIPLVYSMKNENVRMTFDEIIKCESGCRYIVNVGSVGQPRNQDKRACALLYDSDKREMRYLKADYDVKEAQAKILEARLPKFLAERLERGL